MYLIYGSLQRSSFISFNHPQFLQFQTQCRATRVAATLPYLSTRFNSGETRVKLRRSAEYHPSIWDHRTIQSLRSPYTYECFSTHLEDLKRQVIKLLKSTKDSSPRLKLIDSMQRLGVAYQFEEEIKEALDIMYIESGIDLYTTALRFRLLRQHVYPAGSDLFNILKCGEGRSLECFSQDAEGLLRLYEASHLGLHEEDVLEEAKKFSDKRLKSLIGHLEIGLAEKVKDALEIPLHWRMPRLEARNFISIYEKDQTKSLALLELAKLDFNLVQSVHQSELRELSMWWKDLGLVEKLSFARDRLMENYLWALGISSEPQFSKCRKGLTKFVCILTVIDDIYDVYGSLDELELFTEAVNRWDITAMENLPDYMKICYLAMFNFGNEIACDIPTDDGLNVLPYIKNEWARLCRSYLVEARWFYRGYTPTLDEYLGNSWISVGGPAAMVHAFLLQGCTITNELLHCLNHGSNLFYWSSLITRLCDDLGTSKAEMMRGDVAKAIQCHMKEKGISEEEAQHHIKDLINDFWKNLNKERLKTSLPTSMVNMTLNMARTSHCIFQHGDGIGNSSGVTKDRLVTLLKESIPID